MYKIAQESIMWLGIICLIGAGIKTCTPNDPPTLSNNTEWCLTAVQITAGEKEVIIVSENLNTVKGDLRGTFHTLNGNEFAFECRLSDQHVYYIAPKGTNK